MNINENNRKNKHRVFIAVPLTEEAIEELKKNVSKFPGRKVSHDKWHFTLEFLGDVKDERLPELTKIFEEIPLPSPFQITFTTLGAFPHSRSARVLWAGIKEGERDFSKLSEIFREHLGKAHFRIDERPFVPHVTLSRLHHPENISRWIEQQPFHKVHMKVEKLILYESILEPEQSRYSILCMRSL